MEFTPIVPVSCANTTPCKDTGAFPDLGWLAIPEVILCVVVIAVIVYFAIKGSRGQ